MGDPQIYVRGFPKYTTEEELRSIFSVYGDIREVRMIRDYAFIVPNIPCRSSREKMPPERR
jgi:RNA recognition motif-containing protein